MSLRLRRLASLAVLDSLFYQEVVLRSLQSLIKSFFQTARKSGACHEAHSSVRPGKQQRRGSHSNVADVDNPVTLDRIALFVNDDG